MYSPEPIEKYGHLPRFYSECETNSTTKSQLSSPSPVKHNKYNNIIEFMSSPSEYSPMDSVENIKSFTEGTPLKTSKITSIINQCLFTPTPRRDRS